MTAIPQLGRREGLYIVYSFYFKYFISAMFCSSAAAYQGMGQHSSDERTLQRGPLPPHRMARASPPRRCASQVPSNTGAPGDLAHLPGLPYWVSLSKPFPFCLLFFKGISCVFLFKGSLSLLKSEAQKQPPLFGMDGI